MDYANTRLSERLRINPGIIRQLGRHLSVDLSTTWERLEVRGDTVYTATIAQSVIASQFTPCAMLRGILQLVDHSYNTAAYADGRDSRRKTLFSQVLGSSKLNPQTVVFVGYSDAAAGNQEVSLTRTSRTFFAKVGHALMPSVCGTGRGGEPNGRPAMYPRVVPARRWVRCVTVPGRFPAAVSAMGG